MSRSDNTLPWRLREEDRPDLPWSRILNTEIHGYGRREMRRWQHAERFKAKLALRGGEQPAPTRTRHSVRWDMW